MKTLDITTADRLDGNFKNGKKVIAVSQIFQNGKIIVFEIEKERSIKFTCRQYVIYFYTSKKMDIIKYLFESEMGSNFLNEIVCNMRTFEKDYNTTFSFFVLERFETLPILKGDGMNLENIIRSIFEKGFFPKKYFELKEKTK